MMSSQTDPTGTPVRDGAPQRRKRKLVWVIFLMLLLGGSAFVYRDALRDTRLGNWLGLEKDSSPKVVYYCPMHPDYKSDKPGTCPICNMTLEKLEPVQEAVNQKATPPEPATEPTAKRKILYWQDPMNPAHKSDKPGKAPDGMDLIPVYADESPENGNAPAGTLKISARRQQLIGVQFGEVTEQPLSKILRAVGRVTYDETRVARLQTKVEGWIDRVYVDFTGKLVTKGQPLISLYSPQLVSTQQELLIAKKARDTLGNSSFTEVASGARTLYDAARERLRLWDISDAHIKAIERTGVPSKSMTLSSPIGGYVLTRNAFPGQRVTPETELYTIADLSSVWVMADVYEYEIPLVQVGQTATMGLTYFPGKAFKGKVAYIYPELDNMTRTLKVRLDFPNPELKLKPDMYANVELKVDFGAQLSIPEDAVMDSGMEQIVFVAQGEGSFEPRQVRLGAKVDDRYIVLGGLKSGEKIVTSGNFLIDSESKLKSALGGLGGAHAGHSGGAPPEGIGKEQPAPESQKAPVLPQAEDHSRHEPQPRTMENTHTDHPASGSKTMVDEKPANHSGHGQ